MCATKTTTAFAGDSVVDLGIAEVRRAVEGGWHNRTHDRTTTAPHSRSVPPTTGVGRAFDDRGDHPVRGCAPHHRTERMMWFFGILMLLSALVFWTTYGIYLHKRRNAGR